MKELVVLAVGIEMAKRMKEGDVMGRIEAAQSEQEKIAIVRETEKFCFETADLIFKSDEEIGEEGVQAKQEFIQELIGHQYSFFKLPNPLQTGTTFDEVKSRNGYGESEVQTDEFFM